MKEQDTFLDRSTLLALGVLVVFWFGWSSYMKKKYPPQTKVVSTKEQKQVKEEKQPPVKKQKENLFYYSGKNFKIVFSTLGFGIKKWELTSFSDQKNKPIVFEQKEGSLFATRSLGINKVLPFNIKKIGDRFVGWYRSPSLVLKKTIVVNEEAFTVSVKTEIINQKKNFEGLAFHWTQNFKQSKSSKKPWYSFLLLGLSESLTGFVVSDEGLDRFISNEAEPEKKFKNVSLGAVGIKYFGQVFVNKSPLLPSLRFEQKEESLTAKLSYETLNKKQKEINYLLFLGPKEINHLLPLHPKAQNWIDYGFFDWLARPLLTFLKFLYKMVHNWGWAIVLLTFFIRLLLLPINIKSYKSMKTMQKLQKPIQDLKNKYKKNPQELNQKMLALMKENKANPLGGCLPLFLQFPVFFALYRVLGESLELYKAPFIFWIEDLSLKDPFYILPILGGIVLFAQQKLTPMNVPKAQARILTLMPLLFSLFMLGLPSGLTLYIFVSGLFGFSQQIFFVKLKSKS